MNFSLQFRSGRFYLGIPLMVLFSIILIRTAWVSDDAYLTFRTIRHFWLGYGFCWNIFERVQIYTHPLWMIFLTITGSVTKNLYYTAIFNSIILSCGVGIILFFKFCRNNVLISLSFMSLVFSKSFIDYSTSGLENPLSHFLLSLFFLVFFFKKEGFLKEFYLSLISGFILLNRMDLILLVFPALILKTYYIPLRAKIKAVFIGFAPFMFWELFSFFYYGFFIPNTAYAKLNTGIDRLALFEQGMFYFEDLFVRDPVTLIILFSAFFVSMCQEKLRLFGVGLILYLLYILWIGGDFMSGRFFSSPFVFSLFILVIYLNQTAWRPGIVWIFTIFLLGVLGISSGVSPAAFSGSNFGFFHRERIFNEHLITDERAYYYPYTGLLKVFPKKMPQHYPWEAEIVTETTQNPNVRAGFAQGFYHYQLSPDIHIVDQYALGDALLSKLPFPEEWHWRIGHYTRKIPSGYLNSIEQEKNIIADPALAKFYEYLKFIIRGPLFSSERLKTAMKMNLHHYDDLIQEYAQNRDRHV